MIFYAYFCVRANPKITEGMPELHSNTKWRPYRFYKTSNYLVICVFFSENHGYSSHKERR